ncbi:MAG: hypothetical protein AAF481_20295, partial [Acidobacteriota bacterium]
MSKRIVPIVLFALLLGAGSTLAAGQPTDSTAAVAPNAGQPTGVEPTVVEPVTSESLPPVDESLPGLFEPIFLQEPVVIQIPAEKACKDAQQRDICNCNTNADCDAICGAGV